MNARKSKIDDSAKKRPQAEGKLLPEEPAARTQLCSESTQMLCEVEQRYQMLFSSINDPVYVIAVNPDGAPGRILDANEAACKILGHSREQLLRLSAQGISTSESCAGFLGEHFRKLQDEGRVVFETTLLTKTGEHIPVEVSARSSEYRGQPFIIAIARDMTLRKQAEQTLLVKDRAIESAINAIAFADLNGNLTYANSAFLQMWGYDSSAEILGRPAVDFWQFREKAQTVVDELRTRGGWIGELIARGRNGSLFDVQVAANMAVDETGRPVSMQASFVDITDRKKNEQALRESEELLRKVLTNLHGVVFCVDKDGIFILSEGKSLSSLGLQPGEVVGQSVFEIYKDVPEVMTGMRTALAGKPWSGVVYVQGLIFDTLLSPIFEVTQRVQGVVGIATDITQREQVRAQLIHSSKLAAIGTLAAGVAHEINNPLAIIKGFNSVLRHHIAHGGEREEAARILEKQDQAAERVANIVSALRTFARTESTVIETVDLHMLIEDTLGLCEALYAKSTLPISVELKSSRPLVQANFGKLQQVLMNLISNAKDACEDSPRIGKIVLETWDERNSVALKVSDNGTGIPKENLASIFEPFFTTKPQGRGTGLGLSISHSIIRSLGGTIAVESEPDVGTSFTIQIPRAPSDLADP